MNKLYLYKMERNRKKNCYVKIITDCDFTILNVGYIILLS
jgi:hypothetical protein